MQEAYTCLVCSQPFERLNPQQTYCSKLCRQRNLDRKKRARKSAKAKAKRATLKCGWCSEPLIRGNKWCSQGCQEENAYKRKRSASPVRIIGNPSVRAAYKRHARQHNVHRIGQIGAALERKRAKTRPCQRCGEPFYSRYGQAKYCCAEQKTTRPSAAGYKLNARQRPCKHCGEAFASVGGAHAVCVKCTEAMHRRDTRGQKTCRDCGNLREQWTYGKRYDGTALAICRRCYNLKYADRYRARSATKTNIKFKTCPCGVVFCSIAKERQRKCADCRVVKPQSVIDLDPVWLRDVTIYEVNSKRVYSSKAHKEMKAALRGEPCWRCGKPSDTVDHRPPLCTMPDGEWDGVCLPACFPCNAAEGAAIGRTVQRARARAKAARSNS